VLGFIHWPVISHSEAKKRERFLPDFKHGDLVICGLLGDYTASCGNYLPTFRDKSPWQRLSLLLGSRPVKMGPTRCPETSVNNYHTTPCNHPKDHRLLLLIYFYLYFYCWFIFILFIYIFSSLTVTLFVTSFSSYVIGCWLPFFPTRIFDP
jgi:hypothetical protein